MTTADVSRLILLTLSAAGIVACFVYALKVSKHWLYTIAPLLLLLNLFCFNATRLLAGHVLSPELIPLFNQWATIIQYQVIITIIGGLGVLLWTKK